MRTVGDVRRKLQALFDAQPDLAGKDLLEILRKQETMSLESWLSAAPKGIVNSPVSSLRAAYEDDEAFADLIEAIRKARSPTKQELIHLYADLFGRPPHLRAKATRDEVIRTLANERITRLRTEKMGRLLGARIPAE